MRTVITATIVAISVSGFQSASHAQDAVIVTGTRFSEDAARLPASVTVLTGADVANSAARTLPELLGEQVGITTKDFWGNNAATTTVDLRGFGVTGAQNTLILVDGRRLNDIDLSGVQWSSIPLSSIERIEIMRGTGAVLYGDGASAGVINIITRSPLRQGATAEVYGRVATYGTSEGQITASMANAKFGIRASAYGYASDGYRANNRNEQANSSAAMRWGIDESYIDVRLATDNQDVRLPGARRIQPSIRLNEYLDNPRGAQTPLDYASRDGRRAGLSLNHRIGDVELSLGIDQRDKDQRSYFDQGGFPIYRADELKVNSLAPRLRLPFALGGTGHRLTLGADQHAWRYDSRRSNLPDNVARPINRVKVSQDVRAYYLHDLVQIGERTQGSLGWRSERVKYAASDALDPAAPGFFFNTVAPAASETQRQTAWELGLKHAFSQAWSAYLRAGRSHRFVNVDEIYENDAFFAAQFQILRPQSTRNNEAGAEWRGQRARLRAAVFRNDVRDEIHLDPFTTGVGNTNLPPSRRQGVEFDGSWQAASRLRLIAAYAYTDARFREGVLPGGAFAIGTNMNVADKKVPLVPAHKANLGMLWEPTVRTRVSASIAYLSEQFMDNDEPNTLGVKIPSATLVDLKLSHDLGKARLGLALNNLLDRKYYNYAVRSAFVADRYSVYPLTGRTIGATLEFKLE